MPTLETRLDRLEAKLGGPTRIAVKLSGGLWDVSDGPRGLTDAELDALGWENVVRLKVVYDQVNHDAANAD